MQQDSGAVLINQQPQGRVVGNRIVYNNNSCLLNCNACVCHSPRSRVILGMITLMFLAFTISGFAMGNTILGYGELSIFMLLLMVCIWNYYRWYLLKKTEQAAMQNVTYNQPMTYPTHPQQYPQSYPGQPPQSYPGQPQYYPAQVPQNNLPQATQSYPPQAPHNYPSNPPYPSTYVPQGHPPQSMATANAAEAGQGAEAPPPSYEAAVKK